MSAKKWQKQRDRAREVLSREVGFVQKPHGGRLRVALAFPNTYFVGMSSLGFQTTYRLFNAIDDVVCERVFLPPKQELQAQLASGAAAVTLESQTPVREFDVFAFSISFEWDYVNLVTMLRLARLVPRTANRDRRDPLVVIGGAVTFVNPEPLALFADVIAAGEGESLIPIWPTCCGRLAIVTKCSLALATRRGLLHSRVLRRALRRERRDRGVRAQARHFGSRGRQESGDQVHRAARSAGDVDLHADTEFGSRFLVEVVRGCANLCRFCWAGYNYLPVRAFPADRILQLAADARRHSSAPAWCRSRCATTRRSIGSCAASSTWATDQPGVAAARRSHRVDRADAAGERRAVDHDRAGSGIRSPAARHQQDGDQPGDSRCLS